EPAQQLWPALPGAVEHPDALSALVDLLVVTAALVAELLLPAAPLLRWNGHVFSRPPLDEEQLGRSRGGDRLRPQRADIERPHVAQQYRRLGWDALGDLGDGSGLGTGRPLSGRRSPPGSAADAGRCA